MHTYIHNAHIHIHLYTLLVFAKAFMQRSKIMVYDVLDYKWSRSFNFKNASAINVNTLPNLNSNI